MFRRLVDDGGGNLWSFPQANRHGTVWSPERGRAILNVDGSSPRRFEEIPHSLWFYPTGMGGRTPLNCWLHDAGNNVARGCSSAQVFPSRRFDILDIKLSNLETASPPLFRNYHMLVASISQCQYEHNESVTFGTGCFFLLKNVVCCLLTVRHGGEMDPSPATNAARMHLLRNASIYIRQCA